MRSRHVLVIPGKAFLSDKLFKMCFNCFDKNILSIIWPSYVMVPGSAGGGWNTMQVSISGNQPFAFLRMNQQYLISPCQECHAVTDESTTVNTPAQALLWRDYFMINLICIHWKPGGDCFLFGFQHKGRCVLKWMIALKCSSSDVKSGSLIS